MKLTILLRDWILEALETGTIPTDDQIKTAVLARGQGLFHPTTTGSGEISDHVEGYMRARVEVSLLFYLLCQIAGEDLMEKTLVAANASNAREMTISDLVNKFKISRLAIERHLAPESIRVGLLRAAEGYGAWTSPLTKGQGKNIDEFLRVLRRPDANDYDEGYLATTAKQRGARRQTTIFPGPLLLRSVTAFAFLERVDTRAHGLRGKFILADIEDHFKQYGVDFAISAGARPRLISELSRIGLLKGSPDAGDSSEILRPLPI